MNPLLTILPLVVVAGSVTYGIVRMFGRIWLEHRIRMTLLEKIENKPEMLESVRDLFDILGAAEPIPKKDRQDYAVTGLILAFLGAACCLAGRMIRVGKFAVGIYAGGWVCVALGVGLIIIGLIIRSLLRQPILNARRD